jgi:hypothetical protein
VIACRVFTAPVLVAVAMTMLACASAPAALPPSAPAIDTDVPVDREWSGLSFKIDPNIDPGVLSTQEEWDALHERLDIHPIPPVDWTMTFVLKYVTVVYDPGPARAPSAAACARTPTGWASARACTGPAGRARRSCPA